MNQLNDNHYKIAGIEFELATNQSLKTRSRIDKLIEKIPGVSNRSAKGLNLKETLEFYSLILKRSRLTFVERIIPQFILKKIYNNRFLKMTEGLQLEITKDFFLKRISLRLNGIQQK